MHILIISTYGFDPHFPSRPEFLLARTLATLGHRVSAVEYHHNPSQPRQELYSENLTIYRCGTFGFFSRDYFPPRNIEPNNNPNNSGYSRDKKTPPPTKMT